MFSDLLPYLLVVKTIPWGCELKIKNWKDGGLPINYWVEVVRYSITQSVIRNKQNEESALENPQFHNTNQALQPPNSITPNQALQPPT